MADGWYVAIGIVLAVLGGMIWGSVLTWLVIRASKRKY